MDLERNPLALLLMQESYIKNEHSTNKQILLLATFGDATDAEFYGYARRNNSLLLMVVISKLEGLPDPYTCGKCAHKKECRCMVARIKCYKYCK